MNRGRYIGAVVVGIAGAIWIAYSLGEIRLAYASRDWPKTAGTVISASAEAVRREDRREHEAPEVLTPVWFRISYQYAVEGVTYNGNQVYAGQWLPISDWGARELRERYPPARKVQEGLVVIYSVRQRAWSGRKVRYTLCPLASCS